MNGFEALGPALTLLRQRRGWSQAELARRSSCTPPMVGNYEAGKLKPSIPTLERLCEALEVDRWGLYAALTEASGANRGVVQPVDRNKRPPEERRLLACLGLDVPPQAEAAFLSMVEVLHAWAHAPGKSPAKGKARKR